MGFRFQKRVKILPGVRVNISKSGVSTSIGGRGATVNVRKGKVKTTIGAPGTGLSYSIESKGGHSKDQSRAQNAASGNAFMRGFLVGLGPLGVVGLLVAIVIVSILLFR